MKKFVGDIEAEIYFLSTEEGGRKSPAYSGYRPQFYYDGQDWVAVHEFVGVSEVYPGQTVISQISFMNPQEHFEKLFVGKEFLIREGQKTIARGKATKILNLAESAERVKKLRKI